MKLDPDTLRRAPAFSTLSSEALTALALCFNERRFGAGDFVFREGDPASSLFFVAEGDLSVTARVGQATLARGSVRAGQMLGEAALIDPTPRLASVRADRASILFEIGEESVTILRRAAPAAARALTGAAIAAVARRLGRLSQRIERELERDGLLP